MAELYFCRISSVNYANGTADITIPDRENQVITEIPFLAWYYEMPDAGDLVAALFENSDGKIGKGVVLGKIFSSGNRPGMSGAGIFYKEFADGTAVKYSPSEKCMEITADKIVVGELEYRKATQKG